MEARSLSLAPRDRRESERGYTGKVFSLTDGTKNFDIDVINLAHGEVVFKSKEPLAINSNYNLLHKEERALSDHWKFSFLREEENAYIYSYVDNDVKSHYKLVKDYEPHMFLNASTYRFFYEEKENDANELGLLFGRLKECASYISVSALLGETKHLLHFDFSSERKDLDIVDFSTADTHAFTVGESYKFQFNFLSVAYAFCGTITEVDSDFNLVSVEFPKTMLATTARIFLRHKCHEKVTVLFGEKKIQGTLKNISISGGFIELEETLILPKDIKAELLFKEQRVNFFVVESSEKLLRVIFEEVRENLLLVRKMILDISSDKIIVREPSNYDKFIELYKKVGYAPSENVEEWERLTKEAWAEQDEVMPGNYWGHRRDDYIESAIGVLPFSDNSFYAHSGCSIRTETSSVSFVQNLSSAFIFGCFSDNRRYFSGAFHKGTGFVEKLFIDHEFSTKPSQQKIFDTKRFNRANFKVDNVEFNSSSIRFQKIDINHVNFKDTLIEFLLDDSEFNKFIIRDYFSFSIEDEKYILVNQTSRDFSTASNVFQVSWLINISNKKITNYHEHVLNAVFGEFKNTNNILFLMHESMSFEADGFDMIWVFTYVNDSQNVLASMLKTTLRTMLKYYPNNMSYFFEFL